MKVFKTLCLSGLILIVALGCFCPKVFSQETESDIADYLFTKQQTFNLSDNTTITVDIPQNWSVKVDSDGNVLFSETNSGNAVTVTILNNTFPFKDEEELKKYIGLHKNSALSTIPNKGSFEEGYDNFGKIPYPWLSILEEDDTKKIAHKILYVFNKEKVFVIVTSISGAAPLDSAEILLTNIVKSILNK